MTKRRWRGASSSPKSTEAAVAVLICAALGWGSALHAQPAPEPSGGALPVAVSAEPSGRTASFSFFNRPIAVLRARVLGRDPDDRAAAARHALDALVAQRLIGPIAVRQFDGVALISVGSRAVLALTGPDVNALAGETVESAATDAAERLRQALDEAVEARAFGVLLRAAALAIATLAGGLLALWVIVRANRAAAGRLGAIAERTIEKSGIADLGSLRASRLLDVQRGLITSVTAVMSLFVVYGTIGHVLRLFPYTRPWGESMRGFLVATAEHLGLSVVHAIPGLFTALVIFVIARFIARVIAFWFTAVEQGRIKARYIYPETAQPTRRLLTALMWLFAIVVAYPYLPGSQSDAFKGVSVFLGLMLTFGSSGIVNQLMSGLMITYSRALRVGDFVRIGEVEGTVIHLGVLSTKIKTVFTEEVTIPNAVVVSQTTTDYSRFGDTEGVFTRTSVTIGYDTPWRQVQSLLLMAAERTTGIRHHPKPRVLQTELRDFYVCYTLLVCLERQESRPLTLDELHANIQDLFNEYGVQIMSPNYVLDPAAPKLVAKSDWFAAPTPAAREPL